MRSGSIIKGIHSNLLIAEQFASWLLIYHDRVSHVVDVVLTVVTLLTIFLFYKLLLREQQSKINCNGCFHINCMYAVLIFLNNIYVSLCFACSCGCVRGAYVHMYECVCWFISVSVLMYSKDFVHWSFLGNPRYSFFVLVFFIFLCVRLLVKYMRVLIFHSVTIFMRCITVFVIFWQKDEINIYSDLAFLYL